MSLFFIVSNLKVNTFILKDQAVPGFEVLCWKAWTLGTLWELDYKDAGLSIPGHSKVYGQVWKSIETNTQSIKLLEKYSGVYNGLTKLNKLPVTLETENNVQIQATTFTLNSIKSEYKKIEDGKWRF